MRTPIWNLNRPSYAAGKTSSGETGLPSVELLVEEVQQRSLTSQVNARTENCSLKTDSETPLPRTASTQHAEPREVKLVPAWNLLLL